MRVGLCASQNFLLGDVGCPYVGVTEEETLVGRKAVNELVALSLLSLLESAVAHAQATVVGNVLAHGEGAVGVHIVGDNLGAVLRSQLVGQFLERGGIVGGPPVHHVSVLVEVASLVVEAVSHLVSDDNAYGAVVACVVGIGVEVGLLQYARGEADFVGRRVVVGVDRLRRHLPAVFVDGFAQLRVLIIGLECARHQHVLHVGQRGVDVDAAIVAPLVGIADFDGERVELNQSVDLGGRAHPRERCYVLT